MWRGDILYKDKTRHVSKMSPFSIFLKTLRINHGLRQVEMANMLGYEQSYCSALELSLKGPPTKEFVNKLINEFELSAEEQNALAESVAASERKLFIPHDAPTEIYLLVHKLRQQIEALHPAQIKLIQLALDLPVSRNTQMPNKITRIVRRPNAVQKKNKTPVNTRLRCADGRKATC